MAYGKGSINKLGSEYFSRISMLTPYETLFSVCVLLKAERTEIKKASMARLMCDNVEGVTKIQPSAFLAATVDSVSKPWFPFKQFR